MTQIALFQAFSQNFNTQYDLWANALIMRVFEAYKRFKTQADAELPGDDLNGIEEESRGVLANLQGLADIPANARREAEKFIERAPGLLLRAVANGVTSAANAAARPIKAAAHSLVTRSITPAESEVPILEEQRSEGSVNIAAKIAEVEQALKDLKNSDLAVDIRVLDRFLRQCGSSDKIIKSLKMGSVSHLRGSLYEHTMLSSYHICTLFYSLIKAREEQIASGMVDMMMWGAAAGFEYYQLRVYPSFKNPFSCSYYTPQRAVFTVMKTTLAALYVLQWLFMAQKEEGTAEHKNLLIISTMGSTLISLFVVQLLARGCVIKIEQKGQEMRVKQEELQKNLVEWEALKRQ